MSDVDLPTEDAYNRHPSVLAGKSRVLGQRNACLGKYFGSLSCLSLE